MNKQFLTAVALAVAACTPDAQSTTEIPATQFNKATATRNPAPAWYLSNDPANALRSDGAYIEPPASAFAGASRYSNGECGVSTEIFVSGTGDAVLNTAAMQARKCSYYPRKVSIDYHLINADGTTTYEGNLAVQSFLNVRQLQKGAEIFIPTEATELRSMAFGDSGLKCGENGTGAILFRPITSDGVSTGADYVLVTRTAADTWIVRTQPDGWDPVTGATIHNDKAWCRATGALYHMPLNLTIKNAIALTP